MSEKLLSIIIPTYNRGLVLPYTLSLFEDQVKSNSNKVELIVCDNASTDNTLEILAQLIKEENWFSYIHYENHVDIGHSISRSADNANGKFILFFGDDDIPAPMLVGTILSSIESHPNVGAILLNKMDGFFSKIDIIEGISISDNANTFDKYERIYHNIQKFAQENYYKLGFLSADVVNRECWQKGKNDISNKHLGYEFVYQILNGVKESENIYMTWPLVIQRNPVGNDGIQHVFKLDWPIYAYVGIPRLLIDLEANGIISNWHEIFQNNLFNSSDSVYFSTIISTTRSCHNESLISHLDELCQYQESTFRKKYTRLIAKTTGIKQTLIIAWVKFCVAPGTFISSIPSKIYRRLSVSSK